MLGEFSISCSIEEHAGAEVDAEKRVQRKMEGKRERIQAMQAWIGEVGSYEREDKGYTHTYIHIHIESFRSRRSAQRGVLSAKFRLEEPKVSLHGPGGSFLQLKNRMDWFQPRTFRKF